MVETQINPQKIIYNYEKKTTETVKSQKLRKVMNMYMPSKAVKL